MRVVGTRPIMTGIDDFNMIRDEGGYYIDKTTLIGDILEQKKGVYLFTRPRRFGKSLNLSMLDSYFNLRYANDPDRFAGLRISELRPNDPEKNAYPVIHVSLKGLKSDSYNGFLDLIKRKMRSIFLAFPELESSEKLNPVYRRFYRDIINVSADAADVMLSLQMLTEMVAIEYGKQVILLIDEYDNAVNEADALDARRSILGFYSTFLSEALKSNRSLKFAVLTGVMQIAKANIFSGLNNLYTDSIFDSRFQEYWGFSEREVQQLCVDFGHPEMFEEAKEWYDGYRFGTAEVYNPWSVLNYADSGFVPKAYWAESSANSILKQLYRNIDVENFGQILNLLDGGSFVTALRMSMTYDTIDNDDKSMYSLMAMTGYLKVVPVSGREFEVSFPNREVESIMRDIVDDMMVPSNDAEFKRFCSAVADGRTDQMDDILSRILVQGSYWNLTDEKSYELILMTVLFGIASQYRIRTEQEGGNGRIDIIMEPKAAGRAGMIIELKKVDSEAELEGAASAALSQIHEKRYYLGMRGTVLLYGISFCGKIPCVKHERLELQ